MSTTDPIGDLITRIRNAQMRRKEKITHPGSRLRASVLEVLTAGSFIRGYTAGEPANGRSEFEIELEVL